MYGTPRKYVAATYPATSPTTPPPKAITTVSRPNRFLSSACCIAETVFSFLLRSPGGMLKSSAKRPDFPRSRRIRLPKSRRVVVSAMIAIRRLPSRSTTCTSCFSRCIPMTIGYVVPRTETDSFFGETLVMGLRHFPYKFLRCFQAHARICNREAFAVYRLWREAFYLLTPLLKKTFDHKALHEFPDVGVDLHEREHFFDDHRLLARLLHSLQLAVVVARIDDDGGILDAILCKKFCRLLH